MTSELRYLLRSQRWTARLARAALLTNLLAIPLLLCLARTTDGIRYLADFPLAWRLGLILGPPVLAIILFRKILPWSLGLLLFAGFIVFVEIAGQRFDETEINPWQPINPDLQLWIERNLGYSDVADFAELYDQASPSAEEIEPLISQDVGSLFNALPWIMKNADLETLNALVQATRPEIQVSILPDAARLIARQLSPAEHRALARTFPDNFQHAAHVSPPCYWDDDTQWRLWQASIRAGNSYTSSKIYDHLQADWVDESGVSPQGMFDGEHIFTHESLALLDTSSDYYSFVMHNHPGVRHLPDYVEHNVRANYPQLSESQRQQIPRHIRVQEELFYFGPDALLSEIRAKPETNPLDCDRLLPLVGPAEYLSFAKRAISTGDDAWGWLNLGKKHASLRGRVLSAIRDLEPSLDEDTYYLFELLLNAEDGLACLHLFAADNPDASDALALLSGTLSRAESHTRRKTHFAKDSSSKASRFLDVALQMKMGQDKAQRLQDMGTIPCGLRKREAVYLVLLFMATGIICALMPGQSQTQEDPEDEKS